MAERAGRRGRSVAFAALLLLALLMRMAVPPGYMLAPGAGAWPVVPCDGFGAAAAPAVDDPHAMHGGQHMAHGAHHAPPADDAPPHRYDKRDHPCAFAGLTVAAAPPAVAAIALPAAILTAASAFRSIEIAVGRGLAAPPPPATGPPPAS